ncbi:hypothetical protein LEMA_P005500.1 [Plenodomus lingam JN3]|uniref:AT DNA binding protein n=1 Tax=Leptosphaeria maculans (strain JN3 / isolate v23.1.3 / race Av1-4-5-6-7-8) TaxID=985895 RepID=E5AEX4_LEPMJ|nr:hypothetical protein LEMA_P005500.1 [Plenodomus lingam JN3]CBY01763.1 hypothetical protein LEMA_P005500.1 [Plenodomus lingam JN3]
MASRGRTATANNDHDRSYDSSPDPLAVSVDENTTQVIRRKATNRTPLTKNSQSKQNRTLEISELDFDSPAKSMVLNTPRASGASPWRIKVTVQAEPGSDEENTISPSVKRVTRTKTTTVPLKDPDAQSLVKRPRGRPRKSDTGVAAKTKRNGTPAKKAARSKSREASVGVAGSSAADVDTDVPPKRRRGRPRKSIQPPTEDEEPIVIQDASSDDQMFADLTSVPTARPKTTKLKKNARLAILTSHAVPDDNADVTQQEEMPIAGTPSNSSDGQLRARKGTQHAKKMITMSETATGGSDEDSDVLTPSSEDDEPELQVHSQDEQTMDTQRANEGPHEGFEEAEETHNIDNYMFDEGTTRMPDDTTVLDSENFSMISVDSLPSIGGSSSPPKPEEAQGLENRSIGSVLGMISESSSVAPPRINIQPGSLSSSTTSNSAERLHSTASPRYTTPVVEELEQPSEPPAIQPALLAAPKVETPHIGRVVTAGVALQGLVDTNRTTPDPSQKTLTESRDQLDDLFRGFSEGTRKELQAGLRLGEQLADGQVNLPSPTASSPIKPPPRQSAPKEGVFRTQRKHRSRLLTPEEQECHASVPVEQSTTEDDVQYPSLDAEDAANSLISPANSEVEMSWHVDRPPASATHVTTSSSREQKSEAQESKVKATSTQQDDYADIWQEEASRSSNSVEEDARPGQESAQDADLFTEIAATVSARGEQTRTRRHRNMAAFQQGIQEKTARQLTPPADSTKSDNDEVGVVLAPAMRIHQALEDEDTSDANEDSDDTGMFFQSNMPNIFGTRTYERRQRTSDKLSLSSLLDQGESLLPESSPPANAEKALPASDKNPFLGTPPRFPGFPCSPSKSSPLRREIRGSDISSDSIQQYQEESSLPVIQSSPFRTIIDGDSMLSIASDQRQFRVEMEGVTDSSIIRVREEANEYLDAYETQERSLNEITEVTEPSRTWYRESTAPAPSPAHRKLQSAQTTVSPAHKSSPRFSNHKERDSILTPEVARGQLVEIEDETGTESSGHEDTEATSSAGSNSEVMDRPIKSPQQQQPTISAHTNFNLFEAFSRPAPPAAHPILSRYAALPKIEPWTKTHYKTLDKLYATHLKHPALFLPSLNPPTPLSHTNDHLAQQFLSTNKNPYVGATFSAWGYSMMMTESLVVLCAVFMELLTLEDIRQYEKQSGSGIEIGNCAPGRTGDLIKGDEVVKRLATIVLGEEVRSDEKKGLRIDRTKSLTITWPQ